MERVVIIGNGGAGKSTLARRLGAFTGLPVYHLDRLFWHAGWIPTPDETWRPLVNSLIATDRWIAEGNYGGTMAERLKRADTIIWLDYPRFTCTRRAFWRGLSQFGRTRQHDMAPGCPERVDREFLAWVWNYQAHRRPGVKQLLRAQPRDKKIIVLRNDNHAARFLLRVYHDRLDRRQESGGEPSIRLALPRDSEALARIHIEGWQAAYQHIFPPEAFAERTIEKRRADWDEQLAEAPGDERVWVSEQEGRVVGFALTRPGLDTDIEHPGELKLFYVDPLLRGRGIGLPLFRHALADLQARGMTPYLYTLKENHEARAWYERRGWYADGPQAPWSSQGLYPGIVEVRYRPAP
ncbi:MAG: GNAT family N-acetyltransferase [Dehalococcoidia bacterium]